MSPALLPAAEVLALADDTLFGLTSHFYSRDSARAWRVAEAQERVAEALECGIVGINEGALAAEAAPLGGVTESGHGREGSVHGLHACQVPLPRWPGMKPSACSPLPPRRAGTDAPVAITGWT